MTGVSIEQWRGNIGIFDKKNVSKKSVEDRKTSTTFIITDFLCNKLNLFRVPLKILYGIILLFLYCATIVTLLPVLLLISVFLDFLLYSVDGLQSLQLWNSFSTLFKIYMVIHELPKVIAFSCACIIITYKKIPKLIQNLIFFIIVLLILLIISGTVEVNPGPDQSKKNLSFAVWNLDSIPARDFARIPLIETLQATYNFDIFGVCESFLDKDIS